MNTLDLLDVLLTRVGLYLPGYELAHYPDNPEDYALIHPRGAILIRYANSDGDNQGRTRTIEVTSVARQQLTAVRLTEAVRVILAGWRAYENASKLVAISDGFVQEREGEWQYAIQFTLTGPAIICTNETDIPTRLAELGL